MVAELADLEQENPQIRQTLQEWQAARQSSGEDPTDWAAFRRYVRTTGAADPGPRAPQEFWQATQISTGMGAAGTVAYGQPPGTFGQPAADQSMFGRSTTAEPQTSVDLHEMLRNWQIDRTRRSEDAYDWNAFRQQAIAQGAQDPGPQEFSELREYDWTTYRAQ